MDDREMTLSVGDLRGISRILAHISDFELNQPAQRELMLDGVLDLIPCSKPCSVLQMDTFYSAGGDVRRSVHRKTPVGQFGAKLLKKWERHVRKRDSPVERALYSEAQDRDVGAARLVDLVTVSEWRRSPEGLLARFAGVADLAYLWVRCAKDDLWVVALRRGSDEAAFSARDLSVLRALGEQLAEVRGRWYRASLKMLTETEQRVFQDKLRYGDDDKASADRLCISVLTFQTHLKNIRTKLGVHKTSEILPALRELDDGEEPK